jgi:hypothetical protein
LIELEPPEAAVTLDPRRRLAHRRGDERRAPHASLAADARKAGALEDTHVLRDRGQRHLESRRKLADRALACSEPRNDRAPCRIGESSEGIVEGPLMVNHMV